MAYEGMTLDNMIQYILSVCKKNDWDVNRELIVEMLNMANSEMQSASSFNLAYWEAVTETDVNFYLLPTDIDFIHDVFIQETGEEGFFPLKRATLREINASLAQDTADNIVEP